MQQENAELFISGYSEADIHAVKSTCRNTERERRASEGASYFTQILSYFLTVNSALPYHPNLKTEEFSPSFHYKISCVKMKLNIYKETISNYSFIFSFFELSTKNLFILALLQMGRMWFFDSRIRECFYVIYFHSKKKKKGRRMLTSSSLKLPFNSKVSDTSFCCNIQRQKR